MQDLFEIFHDVTMVLPCIAPKCTPVPAVSFTTTAAAMKVFAASILLLGSILYSVGGAEATPSWEELDERPLPPWYDQAKFGIFLHWGVFSVPAYGNEWFWYSWKDAEGSSTAGFVNATERPRFAYPDYASRFTAELYQPEQWAEAFAQSGAQYVVLTSKHHEGFCKQSVDRTRAMFGSRRSI